MIDKRIFSKTGEPISLLGFGCMRLPTTGGRIDEPAVAALFDRALALGVNYFDTAYPYHGGESEKVVGRQLIRRHARASFRLATKLPAWLCKEAADFERLFEEQLARLQTTYIDFYLIHAIEAEDWRRLEGLGINDFIARELASGRIRHLGFSSHDKPEGITEILDAWSWDFVQLQINYLDWGRQRAQVAYEAAASRGLPVIVMEPVRGGGLATLAEPAARVLKQMAPGRSLASWAIRWCGSLPQVLTVLSGMNQMAQLEDNVAQFSPLVPVSAQEQAAIDTALAKMAQLPIIPCTACGYCSVCPQSIAIPDIFEAYNTLVQMNTTSGLTEGYLRFTPPEQRADRCTQCGTCLPACPQHIDIPGELERVHKRALQAAAEARRP